MNAQPTNQQFTIPISTGGTIRLSPSPAVVSSPSPSSKGGTMNPVRTTTYTLVPAGPGGGLTRLVSSGNSVFAGKGGNFRIINPQQIFGPGGVQQRAQYVMKRPGAANPARVQIQANRVRMVNGSPKQQPVYQQQSQFMNQGINVGGQPTRLIHHLPLAGHSPQKVVVNSAGNPVVMRKVMKADSPLAMDSVKMTSPPVTPPQQPLKRKSIQMRLRCRTRPLPLQLVYFENNEVLDKDADVIFLCGDGGRVKGHKLILASISTFFTDAFSDQPLGEISTVSVPDITSDTMKLILLLAYKSSIVVNAEQIKKMKEHLSLFGLNFDSLSTEMAIEKGPLDVQPGKVDENIRRTGTGRDNMGGGSLNLKRKIVPSFTSAQLESLQTKKTIRSLDARSEGAVQFGDNNASDDDTFKIQGYTNESHFGRRKAKLTPRTETEIQDSSEADFINFPESDENMLKEWMDSVGKNGSNVSSDARRPRLGQKSKLKCKTCSATFFKEAAWKWHEDRHYNHGIYKCTICDSLKTTARRVWFHEEGFHKFVGLPLEDIEESQNVPAPPQSSQRPDQQVLAMKLAHLKRIRASRAAATTAHIIQKKNLVMPKKTLESVKTYKAFPNTYNAIKIGQYSDAGELDSKKIKQLHWLYVCGRCDNCSDSAGKAQVHYKKCYPTGEALFEATVTKYRQGFYGRSKCPICPRRYVSNGGWTIHVGHQHQSYRKLFSHTGNVEDKLKCATCNKKFSYPEDFNCHLTEDDDGEKECRQDPSEELMPLLTPAVRNPPIAATEGSASDRRKKNTDAKLKPPSVAPTPTPPRSARLAKRASALLMAKVLNDREDSDEEKIPFKRRTSTNSTNSATEFPPVDCPICGASDISNISQHLTTEHNDMNVRVERISLETLKCCRCRLTFGIDDVFGHPNVCNKNSRTGIDEDTISEVSDFSRPATPRGKREKVVEPIEIPAGVGCSPVDQMEYTTEELNTKEFLLKQLQCPVCKTESPRMGGAANCLKSHGINRCSICFNTYSKKEDYDQHMKSFHSANTRPKCPLCPGKSFSNVGQCVGHLHSIHWVDFLHRAKKGKRSSVSTSADQEIEPITNITKDVAGTDINKDAMDMDTNEQSSWDMDYVCAKCDNCSEGEEKARLHFKDCYSPTQFDESLFEDTVSKYPPGSRRKIPLTDEVQEDGAAPVETLDETNMNVDSTEPKDSTDAALTDDNKDE